LLLLRVEWQANSPREVIFFLFALDISSCLSHCFCTKPQNNNHEV